MATRVIRTFSSGRGSAFTNTSSSIGVWITHEGVDAISKRLTYIQRKAVPAAALTAINAAAEALRKDAARDIAKRYRIAQKVARMRVRVHRARFRARPGGRTSAAISAWSMPILPTTIAKKTKARLRQTARGAKIARHSWPGSFVQTMPRTGYKSIFYRTGQWRVMGSDSNYAGQRREIIKERTLRIDDAGRMTEAMIRRRGPAVFSRYYQRALERRLRIRL